MDSSNEGKKKKERTFFFIGNYVLEIVEKFTIWEIYFLIIPKLILQIDAYKEDIFSGKNYLRKLRSFLATFDRKYL